MNKDEILEKSRKENVAKRRDEREMLVFDHSGRIAALVSACICIIIMVNEVVRERTTEGFYVAYSVVTAICSASLLYKYRHLKKTYQLIAGSVLAAIAAAGLVMYFVRY